MAPILRQSNAAVSSARAPHGTHGTARKLGVGIGIRADGNSNTGGNAGLASAPLIVALVAVGLLSLIMFSLFGRRMLEAGRRRHNHGQGNTETASRTEDHYLLLADMLGLSVGHVRQRMPQRSVSNDRPKMWDIQFHARPPRGESHKEHSLCWGDIMPISVMVEERSRVRDRVQATPPLPRADRQKCCLIRWLCRRGRRPMPGGGVEEAVQDEQQGRREEKPRVIPHKDIQVVVAIAMPCRPRQISSLPSSDRDVHMNYSIGVQAIPWNAGDL